MTAPAVYQNPALAARKVRFHRVLAAEWIKLRSLRSTWWLAGVYLLLTLGMQLLLVFNFNWDTARDLSDAHRTVRQVLTEQMVEAQASMAVYMVVMVLAVAGVLSLTNEYSSGMIRSTFAAVPRRWPVFLAKALLISLFTMVLMAIIELMGGGLAALVAGGKGLALAATPTVWRILVLSLVAGALLVLLFLGLGALLRSSAGGIAVAYGLSTVVPFMLLPLLSRVNDWFYDAIKFLPMGAAGATTSASGQGNSLTLSLGPGLAVLGAWAAGAMILGGWRFMRRDA